jgi:hypothetical protein
MAQTLTVNFVKPDTDDDNARRGEAHPPPRFLSKLESGTLAKAQRSLECRDAV